MTDNTMTIDMTPTWEQTAGMLAMIFENGTEEGKQMAKEELLRMGQLLDELINADTGDSDAT